MGIPLLIWLQTVIISACLLAFPSLSYARRGGHSGDDVILGYLFLALLIGVPLYVFWIKPLLEQRRYDRDHRKWLRQYEIRPGLDRKPGRRTLADRIDWDHCRYQAYSRAGGKCQSCGMELHIQRTGLGIKGSFHVHHKMPLSLGGSNSLRNLELLCPACHSKKHGSQRFSG